MSKSAIITARVDEETLKLVDRVSKAHNRSRAWFAARAIAEAARKEAEYLAFVQEGIDAADRGDLIPHEEMIARIDAMIARHKTRCAP
jgi:predicted transcriptional regulator